MGFEVEDTASIATRPVFPFGFRDTRAVGVDEQTLVVCKYSEGGTAGQDTPGVRFEPGKKNRAGKIKKERWTRLPGPFFFAFLWVGIRSASLIAETRWVGADRA